MRNFFIRLKFLFLKFKKFFFSLFSAFFVFFIFTCFSFLPNNNVSAAIDTEALTIHQTWNVHNSYYQVVRQTSGNHSLDDSGMLYQYSMPGLTDANHFTGAGNWHFSGLYYRYSSLTFHLATNQPLYLVNTTYQYKYNCLLDFYFKNYLQDGQISMFVNVQTNLNESFTYSAYNIAYTSLGGHSFDLNTGKLTINFYDMFSRERFNSERYVTYIEITFQWHNYTSSSAGATFFFPEPTYVPYFEDLASAPVYPDFNFDDVEDFFEAEDKFIDDIFKDINYFTDLIKDFLDGIAENFNTFVLTSNILSSFIDKGSPLYIIFVSSLALGSVGFIVSGVGLISRGRR